jgi:hypothetical protein
MEAGLFVSSCARSFIWALQVEQYLPLTNWLHLPGAAFQVNQRKPHRWNLSDFEVRQQNEHPPQAYSRSQIWVVMHH